MLRVYVSGEKNLDFTKQAQTLKKHPRGCLFISLDIFLAHYTANRYWANDSALAVLSVSFFKLFN